MEEAKDLLPELLRHAESLKNWQQPKQEEQQQMKSEYGPEVVKLEGELHAELACKEEQLGWYNLCQELEIAKAEEEAEGQEADMSQEGGLEGLAAAVATVDADAEADTESSAPAFPDSREYEGEAPEGVIAIDDESNDELGQDQEGWRPVSTKGRGKGQAQCKWKGHSKGKGQGKGKGHSKGKGKGEGPGKLGKAKGKGKDKGDEGKGSPKGKDKGTYNGNWLKTSRGGYESWRRLKPTTDGGWQYAASSNGCRVRRTLKRLRWAAEEAAAAQAAEEEADGWGERAEEEVAASSEQA